MPLVEFASPPWISVEAKALPPPRPAIVEQQARWAQAVKGRFSTAPLDRLSYARDLWPLALLWVRQGRVPPPPDGIAWPGTEAEVSALVGLARELGVALIPFGGGSGVCGGTWAVRGGVSLDLKRFDRLGPVDARRHEVTVGAGVFGERLERHLNAQGFTLGHFPSSIAMSTVGGWLAARSAGQLSSRYGKIEDMVLSLRAVLGTGEVVETPRRPSAGPDLAQLLVGSEGCFGAFTQATLRVFPLPEGRVFRAFEFGGVGQGLEAMRRLLREGLRPAVARLYDPFDTAFVSDGPAHQAHTPTPSQRTPFERQQLPGLLRRLTRQTLGRPGLMNQLQRFFSRSRLVLMFEGDTRRCEAEDRAAADLCRELGAEDLGPEPARAWFRKRYDVGFKLSGLIDAGTFADTMEVSAPWERVEEVYQRVHAAASPFAFVLCHFSHAWVDGCSLYFSFVGSAPDEAQMEARYHRLWRAALGAAQSAGANVSHHHGVGLLKAQALQDSLGEGRHALATLKRLFDPSNVMNPGKLGL